MICEQCYHKKGCKRKPTPQERCEFYVKDGPIDLDEDLDVNPMDTFTFDYDTLKKLFKDIPEVKLKTE